MYSQRKRKSNRAFLKRHVLLSRFKSHAFSSRDSTGLLTPAATPTAPSLMNGANYSIREGQKDNTHVALDKQIENTNIRNILCILPLITICVRK